MIKIINLFLLFLSIMPFAYSARRCLENENPFYNCLEQGLNETFNQNMTLKEGLNSSFYNLNATNSLIVLGNVNITLNLSVSGEIYLRGESMQIESTAFKISNGTSLPFSNFQYSNITLFLGVDNASILRVDNISNILKDAFQISNYSAEYSSTGFKKGNLTTALTDGSVTTISSLLSLTSDNVIVNKNLYIVGNISNINISNLNINGSLYPIITNQYDIGNGSFQWRTANFSGVGEFGSITSPTTRMTNLQDLDGSNFFDTTGSASQTLTSIDSTGALTFASISITESQISNLQSYLLVTSTFFDSFWKLSNFTTAYDNRVDRFLNLNWTTLYNNIADRFGNSNWTTLYNNEALTRYSDTNASDLPFSLFEIGNVSNTLFPTFNATKINATNITATNITALRFTGKLDCGMIDGGSDADYCADASGGADASAFNLGNYSVEYASTGYKIINSTDEYARSGWKIGNMTSNNLGSALSNNTMARFTEINITGQAGFNATIWIGNGSIQYNGSHICLGSC